MLGKVVNRQPSACWEKLYTERRTHDDSMKSKIESPPGRSQHTDPSIHPTARKMKGARKPSSKHAGATRKTENRLLHCYCSRVAKHCKNNKPTTAIIYIMSPTLTTLRLLASPVALVGTAMIFMGVGVLPVDPDLWAVAQACIGKGTIKAAPFFITLGFCKIMGVAGLWGYGIFPKKVAYAACGIPAMCAVYGHTMIEDGKNVGAGIYLLILGVASYLEGKQGGAAKTKKD
jgi:hypothetical protein